MFSQFFMLCFIIAYAEIFHFCKAMTSPSRTTTEAPRITKILCLHGYLQNMNDMREKSGAFRKYFDKNIKFDFVNAPNRITQNLDEDKGSDPRSWWYTLENGTYDGTIDDKCFGFEESLNVINKKYETDGPFNGLLGFSQGAAMAALVIASDQMKGLKRFDFVMLFSGFKSKNKAHSQYYEKTISIPSLHVMAKNDKYVDRSRSEELQKCFSRNNAEVVLHSKGHTIAYGQDLKSQYKDFLLNILSQ